MNRHQSNPFLSDWADELADKPHHQTSNNFESSGGAAGSSPASGQPPRRSSYSQAELSGTNLSGGQRSALLRRNMSSFDDAASLQLEQSQLVLGDEQRLQRELIARMTADFQSAIETSDKQFNVETFNPFDPFETIVDDDATLAPVVAAVAGSQAHKFAANNIFSEPPDGHVAEAPQSGTAGADEDTKQLQPHDGPVNGNTTTTTNKTHDSIDDDDEELVSTPVRNIKTSAQSGAVPTEAADGAATCGQVPSPAADHQVNYDEQTAEPHAEGQESDSRAKATMFAALLKSAESSNQTSDTREGAASVRDSQPQDDPSGADPMHILKGSPNSAGGVSVDRAVGFFDPFETVIDKDALSSLMTSSSNRTEGAEQEQVELEGQEEKEEEKSAPEEQPQHSDDQKTGAESQANTNLHYDSSIAIGRPVARPKSQIQISSGVAPPPVTPSKEGQQQFGAAVVPMTPRARQRQKQRNQRPQDDSSDSSEEDERIQIVIRAREVAEQSSEAAGGPPVVVPLLPPPPSKSSAMKQRERGQVGDMPAPIMSYKSKRKSAGSSDSDDTKDTDKMRPDSGLDEQKKVAGDEAEHQVDEPEDQDDGQFVIGMTHSDEEELGGAGEHGEYAKPETPLYDDDTSYELEEFPERKESAGWHMMLRYPPKKKLTANRFWKRIFVKLARVPRAPPSSAGYKQQQQQQQQQQQDQDLDQDQATCMALQIYEKQEDKKPLQEIPIQATYTVSDISSQMFDQFGKIFTIKLQYIFYKERVGVRQGQLARFIHSGHIGSSTTSGGHGVDPLSIGAIKRMGAPIEHSPQISQIIKLGCTSYEDMKQFKDCLEDCLFRMPIQRALALSTYKTEEVQMACRDETYIELNQIGTITKQLARVRLFFLSFLNGAPVVEVGLNDIKRQGREIVSRMDILPVVTEEWIRLEACELHKVVELESFEDEESRIIKLTPPDATFFELMRFRVRPPRNRELPLQVSANMTVSRTKVAINCEVMVPGEVSRKHGQIPCENIAIRIPVPECWIYFFREEKHFRMGSKKSVNRRPGKVKGIERFLGGGGGGGAATTRLPDASEQASLIEVTSGQAKYEHHYHAIVWRAARWPKESQSAYVQNSMKIRLPLTAYDQMPDNFNEFFYVEYTMPATTVSHTTLRSIAVSACNEEPAEKYVKYSAKYEYKVRMRQSINLSSQARPGAQEASPIVIMKQPDLKGDLQREEDSDDDDDDDDEEKEEDDDNHDNDGRRRDPAQTNSAAAAAD